MVEDSDNGQTDSHNDTALQQQDPATRLLNQQRGAEGHQDLDDSDDDRAQGRVHRAAGRLKDSHCVEDDGVDSGNLLEHHEAEADDQGDAI